MNLVLKPYYEDYQSLLFYEELDKVKFSLSDQFFVIIIVLTILDIPSFLLKKAKTKNLLLN